MTTGNMDREEDEEMEGGTVTGLKTTVEIMLQEHDVFAVQEGQR